MRKSLDAFLAGVATQTPALLATGDQLAARIGSMELAAMHGDPGHWVGNLRKMQQLLQLSGAIVQLSADSESVAQETLTRLCQTERDNMGCIAMMPGPLQMAGSMDNLDAVKAGSVELAEKLCEARPDLLVLREGALLGQNPVAMPQRKAFNTIKNVASYFDVPLAIQLSDYDTATLNQLGKLKLPYLFLGLDAKGELPDATALAELRFDFQGLGLPMQLTDAADSEARIAAYQEAMGDSSWLLASASELARDADLEQLITVTQGIA